MTTTEERVQEQESDELEPSEDAHERDEDITDAADGPDCTCEGGIVRL